ncbi:MAG: hypothetical protein IH592_09075 [Bacteroidales bacterium]|nr:hypothetical protein [Bacteroidales bacterium]
MKRNLLIAFILAGTVTSLSGQDRIITLNNDTIDCKINRVTRTDIHFDLTTHGVTTTGRMPLADILTYSVNPAATQARIYKPAMTGSFPRLRLGLTGGAGYLFSSSEKAEESMVTWGITNDQAESYYRDLKSGICGSGDITLLLTQRIGLGLRYKFFGTSGSVEGFFDPQDGFNIFYSTYSEHIYVNFAGASLFYSEPLGASQKFKIYCAYAAGLTLYRNEAESFQGNFLITGNSFGMDGALGLEYFINPSLAVAAELSAFNALLRKIEVTDGSTTETIELEKENIENLSRIEFSLGIRFYLWNR